MPADAPTKALAERVRNLRGWRRRAAAFAAGAVSVLAMAPFFAWPVLWITLPALVWLIDGAASDGGAARRYTRPEIIAAEIGWWFGFGYFVPGLFWVGDACRRIAPQHGRQGKDENGHQREPVYAEYCRALHQGERKGERVAERVPGKAAQDMPA